MNGVFSVLCINNLEFISFTKYYESNLLYESFESIRYFYLKDCFKHFKFRINCSDIYTENNLIKHDFCYGNGVQYSFDQIYFLNFNDIISIEKKDFLIMYKEKNPIIIYKINEDKDGNNNNISIYVLLIKIEMDRLILSNIKDTKMLLKFNTKIDIKLLHDLEKMCDMCFMSKPKKKIKIFINKFRRSNFENTTIVEEVIKKCSYLIINLEQNLELIKNYDDDDNNNNNNDDYNNSSYIIDDIKFECEFFTLLIMGYINKENKLWINEMTMKILFNKSITFLKKLLDYNDKIENTKNLIFKYFENYLNIEVIVNYKEEVKMKKRVDQYYNKHRDLIGLIYKNNWFFNIDINNNYLEDQIYKFDYKKFGFEFLNSCLICDNNINNNNNNNNKINCNLKLIISGDFIYLNSKMLIIFSQVSIFYNFNLASIFLNKKYELSYGFNLNNILEDKINTNNSNNDNINNNRMKYFSNKYIKYEFNCINNEKFFKFNRFIEKYFYGERFEISSYELVDFIIEMIQIYKINYKYDQFNKRFLDDLNCFFSVFLNINKNDDNYDDSNQLLYGSFNYSFYKDLENIHFEDSLKNIIKKFKEINEFDNSILIHIKELYKINVNIFRRSKKSTTTTTKTFLRYFNVNDFFSSLYQSINASNFDIYKKMKENEIFLQKSRLNYILNNDANYMIKYIFNENFDESIFENNNIKLKKRFVNTDDDQKNKFKNIVKMFKDKKKEINSEIDEEMNHSFPLCFYLLYLKCTRFIKNEERHLKNEERIYVSMIIINRFPDKSFGILIWELFFLFSNVGDYKNTSEYDLINYQYNNAKSSDIIGKVNTSTSCKYAINNNICPYHKLGNKLLDIEDYGEIYSAYNHIITSKKCCEKKFEKKGFKHFKVFNPIQVTNNLSFYSW